MLTSSFDFLTLIKTIIEGLCNEVDNCPFNHQQKKTIIDLRKSFRQKYVEIDLLKALYLNSDVKQKLKKSTIKLLIAN